MKMAQITRTRPLDYLPRCSGANLAAKEASKHFFPLSLSPSRFVFCQSYRCSTRVSKASCHPLAAVEEIAIRARAWSLNAAQARRAVLSYPGLPLFPEGGEHGRRA